MKEEITEKERSTAKTFLTIVAVVAVFWGISSIGSWYSDNYCNYCRLPIPCTGDRCK